MGKNDNEKALLVPTSSNRAYNQNQSSGSGRSESGSDKEPEIKEVSIWEIICCPCICLAAVFAMFVACMAACCMTILYWGGCMPKVKISHIEKYIYGKELWEVYMDQEGVPQDDTARLFCRDFFKTETFLTRIESLFDQFDMDNSGVLKRDQLVDMMTSLNAAMNETLMSMHGAKYKTTQADYDAMQQTYKQMFDDKHAQLDRETFLALAKIMTAQVVLQATMSGVDVFNYTMRPPTTVVIEEIETPSSTPPPMYGATSAKEPKPSAVVLEQLSDDDDDDKPNFGDSRNSRK
uniref:EF-hand domain-containing protein n=1 Tax=Pyramimonas obovata TaxID=1411642 RepID=A0A7S0MWA9_9CHLO|mmetsp:Transcript_14111/g.30184  ORF Transcript_14111/g.30184 Transcript_14111/m.30184 type:complete len:292 (+) Transcript_14111:256-1131(+)